VDLPGIGMRHDVLTESGRKISVVSHRSGERDLSIFDADDPDSSSDSIVLTDDEAAALADVLGASLMLGQLAGLGDQTAGVFTEQISMPADSSYVGRPMGDTKARTRTSASIVAIVRGSHVIPSPTPDVVLEHGDIIVAVGTRSGLDALSRLIARDPN
jgi:TrkA domain protein